MKKRPTTMTAPRLARDWASIVQAATMARVPGNAEEARAAFRALPNYEQMQLAQELVTTRQAELVRAYPDVISVSPGYRLRGNGRRWVEPEVCVILVVKRKWTGKAEGGPERRVPAELFGYKTIGGRRVLCAIPTDVEDGSRLTRLGPQAQIEVLAPGGRSVLGSIACAVTRGADEMPYAIGCRHVFSAGTREPGGGTIRLVAGRTLIAATLSAAGPLANAPVESFDGQLAQVLAERELFEALDKIVVDAFALGWDEFRVGVDYWIRTARGPIRARFVSQYDATVHYSSALHAVHQRDLVRLLLPDGVTQLGDSGAPILTDPDGGKLMGMHVIGGGEERISLAIPGWRLMDPVSYGLAAGETFTLWKGPAGERAQPTPRGSWPRSGVVVRFERALTPIRRSSGNAALS